MNYRISMNECAMIDPLKVCFHFLHLRLYDTMHMLAGHALIHLSSPAFYSSMLA
jgi:hypothetical protein